MGIPLKKLNQNGFSAVEAILILIILGILGFTGWFVYHSQNAADKTYSSTDTSTAPKPTKTTAKTPTKPKAEAPAQSYLTFTEWGVKLPLSGALADARYEDITSAYSFPYSTMQVIVPATVTDTCKGAVVGWIQRVPDNVSQALDMAHTHLGSYNYDYLYPQDCTVNQNTGASALFQQAVQKIASAD